MKFLNQYLVSNWIKDENGATAIEYVLIAAGVGLALVAAAPAFGIKVGDKFTLFATWLT